MFGAILYTQWKWSRMLVVAAAVAAFGLPVISVQGMSTVEPTAQQASFTAAEILSLAESRSIWFAALSAAIGLLLATAVWHADHAGQHQYALSLPLTRSRFVLLRFGSGLVLLAVPVACFAIGTISASATLVLPEGLHSYPLALALRFTLAALVSYAAFFAISTATARTAVYALAVAGGVIAAHVLLRAAGFDFRLLDILFERASYWPGPMEIFTGRWMLIDV